MGKNMSARQQVMLPGQASAPGGPVDLVAMYMMHFALRRDLANFLAAVQRTPPADTPTWIALEQRWRRFGEILHKHHSAEDAGLWPLLQQRAAQAYDVHGLETLRDMAQEHAGIDPLLAACLDGFTSLARAFEASARDRLAHELAETARALDWHLGHEEREAMALVQRHLQHADWVAVEKRHFKTAYAPKEMPFMIAWVLSGLTDRDRERVRYAFGGRPIDLVWRLFLRRGFERKESAAFRYVPQRVEPR
ncbi:hemerythrin domain-containing protein [Kribbella sindirgiensis]|uniref:Hemerythrin domain-containing protein n=1 Tax=Kribbella sindirgiensis TaxID=1124744 RepID=A0A4V2M477_9ACTN|nr:hemerythrin domain-containing protein [Kribbella sindirgiensis]TCC34882.1 hemerythrin domain-containing protein [Kribbella sindirgiensis]